MDYNLQDLHMNVNMNTVRFLLKEKPLLRHEQYQNKGQEQLMKHTIVQKVDA